MRRVFGEENLTEKTLSMRVLLLLIILIIMLIGPILLVAKNKRGEKLEEPMTKIIRPAAVAGAFYPGTKDQLSSRIEQFLAGANPPETSGSPKVFIVPHAGYEYSGGVAAYAYKVIQKLASKEKLTVILIGPSHRVEIRGVVVDGSDSWQSPLGEVEVDKNKAGILVKKDPLFKMDLTPHQQEHSLEVQVPFLQKVLPHFKILPLLVNELTDQEQERVSEALANIAHESTLIIASSDLSHYPSYQDANYADKKVMAAILTGKVSKLNKTIAALEKENLPNAATFLCGQTAVEVAMRVAEKIETKNISLLKYENSGDTAIGDKSQVVGYAAISFDRKEINGESGELNKEEQKELLEIARQSVEAYVTKREMLKFKVEPPQLNKKLGCFVTLKKNGKLRGCIGRFEPEVPLYEVVSQMAVAAATQDSRFSPVTVDELSDLEYEISVLSPLKKIEKIQEIQIGKNGVLLRQGLQSGVFLPQVATENNWSLTEYLDNLCWGKAGLPKDCWKDKNTEIFVFTAQVFGE